MAGIFADDIATHTLFLDLKYVAGHLGWTVMTCGVVPFDLPHWGRGKMDAIFKHIFFNENVRISIQISLKFVPDGPINNNLALVQITAWCRLGDKPLSEPSVVRLPTHICATRPQWVKSDSQKLNTKIEELSEA